MADIRRIETDDELDELFTGSAQTPTWIFKHSLTCPISAAAWRQFRRWVEEADDEAIYTLVEIQNSRALSTTIAERTGVRHESPQALLLRDAEVTWHASHWSITQEALASVASGSG